MHSQAEVAATSDPGTAWKKHPPRWRLSACMNQNCVCVLHSADAKIIKTRMQRYIEDRYFESGYVENY